MWYHQGKGMHLGISAWSLWEIVTPIIALYLQSSILNPTLVHLLVTHHNHLPFFCPTPRFVLSLLNFDYIEHVRIQIIFWCRNVYQYDFDISMWLLHNSVSLGIILNNLTDSAGHLDHIFVWATLARHYFISLIFSENFTPDYI